MDITNNAITVVIKAPNQRVADHSVECMLGWTVKKLKQHLTSVYPSRPVSVQFIPTQATVIHPKTIVIWGQLYPALCLHLKLILIRFYEIIFYQI